MAYTLIETVTVGSGGAASIEFTSIPQDGVDLILKLSLRNTDSNPDSAQVSLNSDTGDNYPQIQLLGNGSSVSSQRLTLGFIRLAIPISTYTANTFGNAELYISNYTSTSNKSMSGDSVAENNATLGRLKIDAFSYTTSSAITSIQVALFGDNYAEYSTASLYKITAD